MSWALSSSRIAVVMIAIAAAAVAHFSHLQINRLVPLYSSDYHNKRFIPKPKLTAAFSLGFNRLLADVYWLNFIQYYGDYKACRDERFKYAGDYLRLILALDSHFINAYWFAAFVLGGDLGQYKEAKELLNYGIKENPDDWSLPYIAGFNQYIYANDDKEAAKYYRLAAKVKGSPAYLNDLAKIMESHVAVKIRKEVRTWEKIFQNSSGQVKEKARDNLQRLWSEIFYNAPTEPIRNRAINKLAGYEVKLLPRSALPLKEVENLGAEDQAKTNADMNELLSD
ncbi:MAG: hypothetical protein K2X27_07475 [Candidatus Obscuribacterales bacterium]|nr:hypothetical protein [Candidatus Obscuribacterales bacterium]